MDEMRDTTMTLQVAEKIWLDGRLLDLLCEPGIPKRHPDIARRTDDEARSSLDVWGSTACWRNYVGTWRIEGSSLLLENISGSFALTRGRPISADWVLEILLVGTGDKIATSNAGIGFNYSEYMRLYVVRGTVVACEAVRTRDSPIEKMPVEFEIATCHALGNRHWLFLRSGRDWLSIRPPQEEPPSQQHSQQRDPPLNTCWGRLCGEYYATVTHKNGLQPGKVVLAKMYDTIWHRKRDLPKLMSRYPELKDFSIRWGQISEFVPSLVGHPVENAIKLAEYYREEKEVMLAIHTLENSRARRGKDRWLFYRARYGYLLLAILAFFASAYLLSWSLKTYHHLGPASYWGLGPFSIWAMGVWCIYRHFADFSAAVFFAIISFLVIAFLSG